MYANENGGRFPERFEDLLLTQDLTPEVFICPSSQGERAPGETREEWATHLSEPLHLTYVYTGKGFDRSAPPEVITAHETPDSHNKDGMNVLYADGHVEFQDRKVTPHLLAELASGHNPPRAANVGR
jgi:prepilin-type processing-associated H-X9-DG protein